MAIQVTNPHVVTITLTYGDADVVKTQVINFTGVLHHIHLVVPAFTNAVTATVSLVDASGRVLWTSAAKAKGASYNLESEAEWKKDQVLCSDVTFKVTLSGAPGAGGVKDVVAVLRWLRDR